MIFSIQHEKIIKLVPGADTPFQNITKVASLMHFTWHEFKIGFVFSKPFQQLFTLIYYFGLDNDLSLFLVPVDNPIPYLGDDPIAKID